MKKHIKILLFVGLTLIVASLVFFLIPYLVTQKSWGWNYKEETALIGSTIGGIVGPIVGFIGAILTFFAFYMQYQANQIQNRALNDQKASAREQKKQILLQQFENNFFELVKLHRANVSEANYTKFDGGELKTAQHRKVFRLIFGEFIQCFREVKGFSNSKEPDDYLLLSQKQKLEKIIQNTNTEIDIIEFAIIDIAYSILFYGIGAESEPILSDKFTKRYNPKYILPLLEYIKLKPKQENVTRWDAWSKLHKFQTEELRELIQEFYEYKRIDKEPAYLERLSEKAVFLDYKRGFDKYYGGHQHRLGHYFRHLFQSYKYLNYNSYLSKDEKYFYGKTLRAQLSTYEQALIFINSISTLGMKWEFTPEVELLPKNKDKSDSKLITRFNLIKNLPGDHLAGLEYKKYYPNVKYETDE